MFQYRKLFILNMKLFIGGKMRIYYINYLSKELMREIKKDETLIIGRKGWFACLLRKRGGEIIEEVGLGINTCVSRYNPEIKKFGSLHITLDKEKQVRLTVPLEATYDVYVNEVITKPIRLRRRKYEVKPNSSITIELDEGSALDLYVGGEDYFFYVGSIELR
jgi:hypothetical protein